MKRSKAVLLVTMFLLLLAGCHDRQEPVQPTPTLPMQEVTATPTPTPEPSPTEEPVDSDAAYQEALSLAEMGEFYHRPFEELPEELRNSLVWDGEVQTIQGYRCRLRTYTAPGIVVTTTEAPEESRQDWLDWQLSLPEDDESREGTEEELWASFYEEEGREWLHSVTITDDSYATTRGLKVGNTVEEAEALGYHFTPEQLQGGYASFGPPLKTYLDVSVEDGVVTQLDISWGLGRYVGKYFEL